MDKQLEFTEAIITLAKMNLSGMRGTVMVTIFIRRYDLSINLSTLIVLYQFSQK